MQEFRADAAREAAFLRLLANARARLAQPVCLRLSRPPPCARAKRQILSALGEEIRAFEQHEHVSYPLYDQWISEGLNNARLASVATYYDCVPGFKRLLAEEDNDLPRFYAAARELAKLPRKKRHQRLCGPAAAAADAAED